jgi:dihydrofolate synthase/folylpolyglutamate synthase
MTPGAIAAGVRRTSWPGRLELLQNRGLEWILDVAHNPAGAWALRAGLRDALGPDEAPPMTLVFACLRDKPLAELAQILFPLFEQVVFAPIQSPRATPVEELLAAAQSTGTPALVASSVAEALDLGAVKRREGNGVVVISGSVYLVGQARGLLMSNSEHKAESPT